MAELVSTTPLALKFRRFWRWLSRPYVVLGLILTAVIAYLVISPFLVMVQTTFTWQLEDRRLVSGIIPGDFTLFHWGRVFNSVISEAMLYQPLWNTLWTSIAVSVFALSIGCLLAWLVA